MAPADFVSSVITTSRAAHQPSDTPHGPRGGRPRGAVGQLQTAMTVLVARNRASIRPWFMKTLGRYPEPRMESIQPPVPNPNTCECRFGLIRSSQTTNGT